MYNLTESQKLFEINQLLKTGKKNIVGRRIQITMRDRNFHCTITKDYGDGCIDIEIDMAGFKRTIKKCLQHLTFENTKKIWM